MQFCCWFAVGSSRFPEEAKKAKCLINCSKFYFIPHSRRANLASKNHSRHVLSCSAQVRMADVFAFSGIYTSPCVLSNEAVRLLVQNARLYTGQNLRHPGSYRKAFRSSVMKTTQDVVHHASYPLFIRMFYAKYLLSELRKDEHCRRKLGIRRFSELDLSRMKRSDTLFILASGASINQISAVRWEVIRCHDSIGFNFWPVHPFVPTMYFLEAIQDNHPYNMFEPLCRITRRRAQDYAEVVKVVTELRNTFPCGRFAGLSEMPGDWHTLRTFPVPASTEDEFSYGLNYLRRKGLFEPAQHSGSLFKQASTLSSLIALAIRMQYKRIVLCGVDLNHSEYFYQDARMYPDTASLEFSPRNERHATNTPMPWRITIESVILEMKRQLLDPADIKIFVENRSSALWPKIDEVPKNLFPPQQVTAEMRERNGAH